MLTLKYSQLKTSIIPVYKCTNPNQAILHSFRDLWLWPEWATVEKNSRATVICKLGQFRFSHSEHELPNDISRELSNCLTLTFQVMGHCIRNRGRWAFVILLESHIFAYFFIQTFQKSSHSCQKSIFNECSATNEPRRKCKQSVGGARDVNLTEISHTAEIESRR